MKTKWFFSVSLVALVSLVLSACGGVAATQAPEAGGPLPSVSMADAGFRLLPGM